MVPRAFLALGHAQGWGLDHSLYQCLHVAYEMSPYVLVADCDIPALCLAVDYEIYPYVLVPDYDSCALGVDYETCDFVLGAHCEIGCDDFDVDLEGVIVEASDSDDEGTCLDRHVRMAYHYPWSDLDGIGSCRDRCHAFALAHRRYVDRPLDQSRDQSAYDTGGSRLLARLPVDSF